MDGQLTISYSWLFLAGCLFLGLGAAALLYHKDRLLRERPRLRYLLFTFRAALITILAFLLLGPVWKGLQTRTERPVIIYLEDISRSVAAFTPEADLKTYRESRDDLYRSLGSEFEIERYRFGGELLAWQDSTEGADRETDISAAIDAIIKQYSYQQIGAVILASDGIYNQGFNPAYTSLSTGTSIYTIALGDSTESRDLFIQGLQYPRVVYLGDRFQFDLEWGASNMANTPAVLTVVDDAGREVFSKSIRVVDPEQFGRESIILDADEPGIRKYTARISVAPGEEIRSNNSRAAYVEVLDGRKKVAVLYRAPHPDIRALRTAVEGNRNYELDVSALADFTGSAEGYDLFILHGLPAAGDPVGRDLLRDLTAAGKPVWIICSGAMDYPALNEMQPLVAFSPSGRQLNEVQALLNADFREFQIPEGSQEAFRIYPPLLTPFGEYETGPGAKVIAWQRLDDINTGYPLLVTGRTDGSRLLLLTGEGIWRWRMSEYARKGTAEVFDALIGQLTQYMAVQEDKRKFRLFVNDNLLRENEEALFHAELYNASYELVNEGDVRLVIRHEDGAAYEFTMDKTLNSYRLDAGLLPVGNYRASATTSWSGTEYDASVRFTVREVELEMLRRQADHQLLYNLSEATGGQSYLPSGMDGIAEDIRRDVNLKPLIYQTVRNTPLLQFHWILIVLLVLLSTEWFVRKWLGGF